MTCVRACRERGALRLLKPRREFTEALYPEVANERCCSSLSVLECLSRSSQTASSLYGTSYIYNQPTSADNFEHSVYALYGRSNKLAIAMGIYIAAHQGVGLWVDLMPTLTRSLYPLCNELPKSELTIHQLSQKATISELF